MTDATAAGVELPRLAEHIALSLRNRAARLSHLAQEVGPVPEAAALLRCGRLLCPELEHLATLLSQQAAAGDFAAPVAADGDGWRVFPADIWGRVATTAAPAAELADDLATRPGLPRPVARYCALVMETARVIEDTAAALPQPTHAERWGLVSAST